MILSPAQKTALKADIAANATTIPMGTGSVAINSLANTPDNNIEIAKWYNLLSAYLVWNKKADKATIDSQIVKSSFTPSDAPDNTVTFQNRAMICQLKQFNAQWLVDGTGFVDASVLQTRGNFKDCLTQIPAGTAGANLEAGWGTGATPGLVRAAMQRFARNWEKIGVPSGVLFAVALASGPGNDGVAGNRGTNTNPDNTVLDGELTGNDVTDARTNG